MRILILPSWYFKSNSTSIAGYHFLKHAMALQKEGIDAQIAFGQFGPANRIFTSASFSIEKKVPTVRLTGWSLPKSNSIFIRQWIRTYGDHVIKYFRNQGLPDIIHAQGYQAGWVARYIYQQTNIPYVLTEHYSGFLLRTVPSLHLPFIREAITYAALCTAVSPGLRDVLQPLSSRPIEVVPNFYDASAFYPNGTIKKNMAFTFISVGEPAKTKGLDLLLRAFASIKKKGSPVSFHLIIVDQIPEEKELKNLAVSLAIDQYMTWTGLLSPDQMGDLLRECHVLVSASRVETFGNTLIEAQACGLPVVATKTAGATFIIHQSAQGELAEVGNTPSLEEAMWKVFKRYSEYNLKTIYEIVQKRFSQEVVIRQWMDFYQSIRL